MEPIRQERTQTLYQVIQIDERKVQAFRDRVVQETIEETLNAMLDAEADRLCRPKRYKHSEPAKGHYVDVSRFKLDTRGTAGVQLRAKARLQSETPAKKESDDERL